MSRIIKAEQLQAITTDGEERKPNVSVNSSRATSVFDSAAVIRSATVRADRIIRNAEESATRLIIEAERRLTEMQATAARQGYAEGYELGVAEGRRDAYEEVVKQRKEALDSLAAATEKIESLRQEILDGAESDLIKFAVLIAERILRRELADPKSTLDIARSILAEVEDESEITVYLPPGVIESIGNGETTDMMLASGMHVHVRTDPSLQPGDTRIETQWGWIDGRGAIRWKRLIGALEKGAGGHGA